MADGCRQEASTTLHLSVDSTSEVQTRETAAAFAAQLGPGSIVALTGPLGSGKTCFARGMIAALHGGLDAFQGSPTFALVQEYPGQPWPVYHFDFYRIRRPAEIFDIGWLEYCSRGHWCLVEWADRFRELMPPRTVWLRFSAPTEGVRRIRLEACTTAANGPAGGKGRKT